VPSVLEQTIATYRRLVLSQDVAALSAINAAYEDALARLRPLIALAQAEVSAMGEEVNPSRVFELERYKELQRQLDAEVQRISRLTMIQTVENQQVMRSLASEAARAMIAAQAPSIGVSWASVPLRAVESLTGALAEGSPLADLFNAISDKALTVARKELTIGLSLGKHPSVVADALEEALKISKTRAMTIARTETLRAFRESSLERYRSSGVVSGWYWVASLSARSCSACIAKHMTFHRLDERMDSHPNCRCTSIPGLEGVELNLKTGAEWFAAQDMVTQDRILGSKAAGTAYRAGDVELDDFARLTHNKTWGDSYTGDSLVGAQMRAERRQRKAA
jgi:SPP1 gp7 family putative phage head morphogenesis protein